MKVRIQTLEEFLLRLQDEGIPEIGPLLRMARDQEARPLAWERRWMRQMRRRLAKQLRRRVRIQRHVRVRGPRSRLYIEQRLSVCHRTGRWHRTLHPQFRAGD
jgi:hypothetical protein